jgi:hypothetical protein
MRRPVRGFAGWNFAPEDALTSDFVRKGYGGGVPMGGDLINRLDSTSPSFIIRALLDPDGANLDHVQVIKGRLDEDGETHE